MGRIDEKTRTTIGRRRAGRSGFTLIELMVALVVLSLGLFSVLQLQVYTVRGHAYAREKLEGLRIAQGVAEELRTRSLEWNQNITTATVFTDVFPAADFPIVAIGSTPPAGTNVATTDMFAVQDYLRDGGGARYTISPDPTVINALPINIFGAPSTTAGMEGQRTAFRVHLVGHHVRTVAGAPPNPNLVRMTVFVSWDNKDFGEKYNWSNWWGAGGDNFFRRHMVTLSFYLFLRRTN